MQLYNKNIRVLPENIGKLEGESMLRQEFGNISSCGISIFNSDSIARIINALYNLLLRCLKFKIYANKSKAQDWLNVNTLSKIKNFKINYLKKCK